VFRAGDVVPDTHSGRTLARAELSLTNPCPLINVWRWYSAC
jgi:hypothetical protein